MTRETSSSDQQEPVGPSSPITYESDGAAGTVRARAFDVASLMATVGLVIALAQLPAWRAAFSSASAIALAASVFVFRYARGVWKFLVGATLIIVTLLSLAMVYLQPIYAGWQKSTKLHSRQILAGSPPVRTAPSPSESPSDLSMDVLQPGDCVLAGNLHFDNLSEPWPDRIQLASCDEVHDGEVYFAADLWAADAEFPGLGPLGDSTDKVCTKAFAPYVGISWRNSLLDYVSGYPSSESWTSGDRHVFCIAYLPKKRLDRTVRHSSR